jgi:dehydrodolichyl diphosphate syntase complex subunit NUS1
MAAGCRPLGACVARALLSAIHVCFALYLHATAAARFVSALWWVGIAGEANAKMGKIPGHVAFALESSGMTPRVVGDLVCACAALGIQEVTVYDPEGRTHAAARIALLSGFEEVGSSSEGALNRCHVTLRHQYAKPVSVGAVDSKRRLDLNCLSLEDGWPALVRAAIEATQQLSEEIEEAATSTGDPFDGQHRLRRNIMEREEVCASEPELLIKVGPTLTVAGFPPWLLRISEIQHVPDLSSLTELNLRRVLDHYAHTEQRNGK